MDNIERKYLFDIVESINKIECYIGESKKFEVYDSNTMLQDAVERNIEIIGEAMNQLLKINSEIPVTNGRRIVDARNKIIHGYDEIENENIWAIVINHLPILKKEILTLVDF